MAEGFEFETSIKDGMSGPARAEAQSLKSLQSEIKSTESAIRKLQEEQLNYKRAGFKEPVKELGLEIQSLRIPLGEAKSKLHELKEEMKPGENLEKGFFKAFDSLVPEIAAGELLAEGVKKVGEAFGDAVIETTKFAVEMSELKENTVSAYEAVLGAHDAGEKTFEDIENLGKSVHMPVERAQALAQDLMLQGEDNLDTIKSTVQAVSDLHRVGLDAGASKLQSIIERSLTQGAFVLPKKLSGLGVQLPDLYADLAKRLGTSVNDVKAKLKAGQINAEAGIAALTDAINNGKVGEVARKKLSLEDVAVDIKNDIAGIFEDIDSKPLLDAFDQLRFLIEGADGSTKDMKTTVTSAFNTIIKWIAGAVEQVEIFGLKTEIAFLENKPLIMGVVDDVKDLAKAFADVLGFVGKVVGSIGKLGSLATSAVGAVVFEFEDAGANSNARSRVGHEAQLTPEGQARQARRKRGLPDELPDHAAGGIVDSVRNGLANVRPAEGEGLASVGAGERIVPRGRATDDVAGVAIPDFSGGVGGRGSGAGAQIHPGAVRVEINFHGSAPTNASEFQEITEHAMYDVLERIAAELGG